MIQQDSPLATDAPGNPAEPADKARRGSALELLGIMLAVVAAHGMVLANGFAWDDQHTVLGNQALRSLADLWRSFSMDDWQSYGLRARGLYRPLATVSFFVDHAIFAFHAAGWHATSLVLHALTALAILRLVRAAGTRASVALVSGVLFAVHPITSEVADWISARPDGLAGCLTVWALLLARTDRLRAAGLLAGAACFAKEPGLAAVPAVLAIAATRRPRRQALESALTAIGGAGAYLLLRRVAGVPVNAGSARIFSPASWPELAGSFGAAATGALRAILWPLPLDAVRRLPNVGPWGLLAAVVAIAVVAVSAVVSIRRRDGLFAALAISAALPLALVAAYGANLSERYLYLPTAAATVALGVYVEAGLRAAAGLRPAVVRAGIAAVAVIVLGAIVASAARARQWGDPVAIFTGATEADPGNADAWLLLGAEVYRRGLRHEALDFFERAAALGSPRAGLQSNLCALHREAGELERAASECERAVALDPDDPRPRYNRALLWAASGRRREAIAELRAIRVSHPAYRPALEAMHTLAPGPLPRLDAPPEPSRFPSPAGAR